MLSEVRSIQWNMPSNIQQVSRLRTQHFLSGQLVKTSSFLNSHLHGIHTSPNHGHMDHLASSGHLHLTTM